MDFRNRKLVRTIQIIFAVILLVFGLNFFFQFMPEIAFNSEGSALLGALFAAGYFFPIMGIIWIIAAISFALDQYSAVSTIVISPITLNMILFHIFLDTTGILFALIVLVLNAFLIYIHWPVYKPMFSSRRNSSMASMPQ